MKGFETALAFAPTAQRRSDDAGTAQSQVLSGLRVLVVDDNDDIADCLATMLRRLGHVPRACCSGRDCLDCLYEFRPDVIVLDLSLPEQDGFEICRLIQNTDGFEDLPIIACSALDRYIVAERAVGCRFSKHLVKPVGLKQLQAAISNAVRQALPV